MYFQHFCKAISYHFWLYGLLKSQHKLSGLKTLFYFCSTYLPWAGFELRSLGLQAIMISIEPTLLVWNKHLPTYTKWNIYPEKIIRNFTLPSCKLKIFIESYRRWGNVETDFHPIGAHKKCLIVLLHLDQQRRTVQWHTLEIKLKSPINCLCNCGRVSVWFLGQKDWASLLLIH